MWEMWVARLSHVRQWRESPQRELYLFCFALLGLGVAIGIFQTTFNNFLDDTFHLGAEARGALEFPRELPGFLCAMMAGCLGFLPESKLGAVAVAGILVGMVGLALLGGSYGVMILFMLLWSSGEHLFMPVRNAIGMQLASNRGQVATRLGQLMAVSTAATLIGCLLVWIAVDGLHLPYQALFLLGALSAGTAIVPLLQMRLHHGRETKPVRFVWRREYHVFYLLSVLFGARKQVFITFAPWVLVKIFEQPPSTFARLWIVSAILGLAFKPLLGVAIDKMGERRLLMLDSSILVAVCLGYGFAESSLPGWLALPTLYLCYVLDQLLFSVGMARSTYLRKIAVQDSDVTPTLSLGVSLDHIVSMSIPMLGGLVWKLWGYPWVFAGAAVISVVNILACALVRTPAEPEAHLAQAAG